MKKAILILSILLIFILPLQSFAKKKKKNSVKKTQKTSIQYSQNSKKEEKPTFENIYAKSVILIDYQTGQILFEKNKKTPIPPASLTKLMTLHILYEKIKEGVVSKSSIIPITKASWALKLPKKTARMFLEPGQKVTLFELMKGLAIPSGNDAAVAIAYYLSGNVENFAQLMNQTAKKLGFKTLHFEDPAGLSENNQITAEEFALFCRYYIQSHPESLKELHSLTELTYPLQENKPPFRKKAKPIRQFNNNNLLGRVEGVDGLKTGFINKSGFNIAVTAKRGNTRLIAVILGVEGKSSREGIKKRELDARKLLDYGFHSFQTTEIVFPKQPEIQVWKGQKNSLLVDMPEKITLTLPKETILPLVYQFHLKEKIEAPVEKGEEIGILVFYSKEKEIYRYSLKSSETIPAGNFFKKIFDNLILFFSFLIHLFS
ncbi:MAG TPA: D-alanyl-D-alanine carboxypeptidase [Spirochaetia bacterium]|nr:MAG: hypothetical protein A2Y41_04705 [Spirochaetes bacterium GWB1_36_13]HCL55622.1 D-alanyl-D-alanine carboxypeptidase [Spirochaetia bacterium]